MRTVILRFGKPGGTPDEGKLEDQLSVVQLDLVLLQVVIILIS